MRTLQRCADDRDRGRSRAEGERTWRSRSAAGAPTCPTHSWRRRTRRSASSRGSSRMDLARVHYAEERNPRIADKEICEVVIEGHGHQVQCKVAAVDGLAGARPGGREARAPADQAQDEAVGAQAASQPSGRVTELCDQRVRAGHEVVRVGGERAGVRRVRRRAPAADGGPRDVTRHRGGRRGRRRRGRAGAGAGDRARRRVARPAARRGQAPCGWPPRSASSCRPPGWCWWPAATTTTTVAGRSGRSGGRIDREQPATRAAEVTEAGGLGALRARPGRPDRAARHLRRVRPRGRLGAAAGDAPLAR